MGLFFKARGESCCWDLLAACIFSLAAAELSSSAMASTQQQTSCDRHASRASSSFSVTCQRDSEVGQRYYILLVHFVFGGGGGSRHFSLCFRLISIPTISFLSSNSSERFRWNTDKYGASLLSVIGWIMTHKLSFTNFWMQKFIKLDCS